MLAYIDNGTINDLLCLKRTRPSKIFAKPPGPNYANSKYISKTPAKRIVLVYHPCIKKPTQRPIPPKDKIHPNKESDSNYQRLRK